MNSSGRLPDRAGRVARTSTKSPPRPSCAGISRRARVSPTMSRPDSAPGFRRDSRRKAKSSSLRSSPAIRDGIAKTAWKSSPRCCARPRSLQRSAGRPSHRAPPSAVGSRPSDGSPSVRLGDEAQAATISAVFSFRRCGGNYLPWTEFWPNSMPIDNGPLSPPDMRHIGSGPPIG